MFDRKEYKQSAKKQLHGKWLLPLCILLGCSIVSALFNVIPEITLEGEQYSLFSIISVPIFYILLGTITIAQAYFFIEFVKDNEGTTVSTFFEGFSLWLKGTLGLLWMGLWIALWSLLFFIPGIIKVFSYSQMFYVLAEHPKVGVRKALRISKEITKGYKGDLFFLSVSFIGWYLLTSIPLFVTLVITPIALGEINIVFIIAFTVTMLLANGIAPYYFTTHTYAYKYLKQAAIDRKAVSYSDFGEQEPLQGINQ